MGVVYNTVAEAEHAFQHKQKFDAEGRTIELCQDCDNPVEVHPYGGAGYVAADSGEVPVQTPAGTVTVAQQRTVCRACYDKSVEKVNGTQKTETPADPSSTPQA